MGLGLGGSLDTPRTGRVFGPVRLLASLASSEGVPQTSPGEGPDSSRPALGRFGGQKLEIRVWQAPSSPEAPGEGPSAPDGPRCSWACGHMASISPCLRVSSCEGTSTARGTALTQCDPA